MDDPGRVRSQEISVVQCVLRSTVCTAVPIDPGLHSDNNNTMIDVFTSTIALLVLIQSFVLYL